MLLPVPLVPPLLVLPRTALLAMLLPTLVLGSLRWLWLPNKPVA